MKLKGLVLVGLVLSTLLIPNVSGATQIRTSGGLTVYKQFDDVRVKITRKAPYDFFKGNPSRSFKWSLLKKDIYGIYRSYKSGYSTLGKYRLYIRLSSYLKATKNMYFWNLPPGSYKFKVFFPENCNYAKLRLAKNYGLLGL
jgi:hypothetical protein